MQSTAAFLLFSAFTVLAGCSGDDAPSPTSAEALRKAPSLQYGCSYTQRYSSSYGSSSSTESTPGCWDGRRCDELTTPDDGYGFGGGAEFNSTTSYEDRQNFVGTCAKHEPLAGDTEPYDSCSSAPLLCLMDPNCIATRDCVTTCGEDDACAKECVENGDYYARGNLLASAECASDGSTSDALQSLFP